MTRHSESMDGILNCGRISKFNDHLMSIKEAKYKRSASVASNAWTESSKGC